MQTKRCILIAGLTIALGSFAAAQDTPAQTSDQGSATKPSSQAPEGTVVTKRHEDTVVQPQKKPVELGPGTVRAAQKELTSRGYDPGPQDGVAGPQTRAAVRKFQADQGIAQTGKLDLNTLEKLNIGGPNAVAAAPSDMGRGGKAFGHDIKEGHPVEAGKAIGSGAESAGKKVGKGAKATAVGAVGKVGEGMSAVGRKITGKTKGEKKKPDQNKPDQPQNP